VKKWLVALTALAVLSLVAAPLALASGHARPHAGKVKVKKVKFQCQARVVVSVDPATNVLVVKVKSGSKSIKRFRGKEVSVTIDPKAKLIDNTGDASAPLTLDKLVEGAVVHLGGIIRYSSDATPTFTATKVILQRLPVAPTPAPSSSPTTPAPTPAT
jgi:hypothetical protein